MGRMSEINVDIERDIWELGRCASRLMLVRHLMTESHKKELKDSADTVNELCYKVAQ